MTDRPHMTILRSRTRSQEKEVAIRIGMERERQQRIGFTTQHDDEHDHSDFVSAALAYAEFGTPEAKPLKSDGTPENWPWDARWWKPKDRKRNLVRAGALVQAARAWLTRNHVRDEAISKRYREVDLAIHAALQAEMFPADRAALRQKEGGQ